MSVNRLNSMFKFLPYKVTKRIRKTKEGRQGNKIYNRRNRRSYRVLMQYDIWNSLIDNPSKKEFLDKFEEGYAVLVKPETYFGNNYPEKSDDLNKKLELGHNGFIFYTLIKDYEKYPPLTEWEEVFELNSEGNRDFNTWEGDYALNIKNGSNGNKISLICKTNHSDNEKSEIKKIMKEKFKLDSYPKQCGLGNYDFDYATPETIENVEYQMLYLLLNSKSEDNESFPEYIYNNYDFVKHEKDTKTFKKNLNVDKETYIKNFEDEFKLFTKECERRNLLNFDKLSELGVWNKETNEAICPLCKKPIYANEFFEDVEQPEGREVDDNTQKEIVLMHVDALRPRELNHRPYNLGWGHNYCNLIQGYKDISETIDAIEEILDDNRKFHN